MKRILQLGMVSVNRLHGNGICEPLTFDGLSVPVVLHIDPEHIFISRELEPCLLAPEKHTAHLNIAKIIIKHQKL